MNDAYAIMADGLTKQFGKFTAVDNVSFHIRKGQIFGFLGANGAGKSTTIRMLTGIMRPSGGNAEVGGYDVADQPEMVKQNIGYMSQRFSLYDDLTVHENLTLYGGIYGLDNSELDARIDWAIETADLSGKEDVLTRELAGGWKQRLALSCALLHNPKIVFLDEPTSGVDPISRRHFWQLIQNISEKGVTVFVTTHYLEEAEYCHKLAFIYEGRIIIEGTPSELKEHVIQRRVFEVSGGNPNEIIDRLRDADFIDDVSIFGLTAHVIPVDDTIDEAYLAEQLRSLRLKFEKISEIAPSLEDVFIILIKKQREHA